jgi:hypothetical protein
MGVRESMFHDNLNYNNIFYLGAFVVMNRGQFWTDPRPFSLQVRDSQDVQCWSFHVWARTKAGRPEFLCEYKNIVTKMQLED